MWWMASSPSIISDNKPSHLCTWLGCFWMRSMLLHATLSLNRCSSDACIKAVLCIMFLLLHYLTMRSDEQVSVIGRLRFMARDHKENLIWFFIIRDVVEHKTEGKCVKRRRDEVNKHRYWQKSSWCIFFPIKDPLFIHFMIEDLAINIIVLQQISKEKKRWHTSRQWLCDVCVPLQRQSYTFHVCISERVRSFSQLLMYRLCCVKKLPVGF